MEGEQKSGRNARDAEQKSTFNLYIRADELDSGDVRNPNKVQKGKKDRAKCKTWQRSRTKAAREHARETQMERPFTRPSQISCEIHYEMAAMCLCFFDVKNATLDREKPGRSGSLSFLGFPSISYADQMLHSLPITSLNICTPYRPT